MESPSAFGILDSDNVENVIYDLKYHDRFVGFFVSPRGSRCACVCVCVCILFQLPLHYLMMRSLD